MIKKDDKSSFMQISQVLAPINLLTVEGGYETTLSRECFNQVFDSLWFRKYISYHDHLFFPQIFKFWWGFQKSKEKWRKKYLVFKIIGFE